MQVRRQTQRVGSRYVVFCNNQKLLLCRLSVHNEKTTPFPLPPPTVSVIPRQFCSSTPVHSGNKASSSARFQTPPRPKSAVVRRTDNITTTPPPSASATSESQAVKIARAAEGSERMMNVADGTTGGRAPSAGAAAGTATVAVAAAAEVADGRSEFRGAGHRGGTASAGRVQHRPRPRSAVARVETTPHHGKARMGKKQEYSSNDRWCSHPAVAQYWQNTPI